MNIFELAPDPGARRKKKRLGRGIGSGRGKTAGRGTKGQKARAGWRQRPGFEGGQMPLQRRLPKIGFSNAPHKVEYEEVNVGALEGFEPGAVVTPEILKERGLVRRRTLPVKILGDGELTKALVIQAHSFSKGAREKIERAGGRAEVI